jgi:septal ring factor EnvC (AmiA/AmiB activator)
MKKLFLVLVCILSATLGFSQVDKARLEKERQELQQELQQIQANYSKVKGQTKATLGQLSMIQQRMNVQDRYIGNISKEIRLINDDIYLSNLEVNRLQVQMDTLKSQYARSLVYAYKNKSSYDFLNFIFSAGDFNDAMRRMSYLRSYRAYRQQQADNILATQKMINDRKNQLMGKQTQKKSALQNQQQQLNELEGQKKEKDAVVSKLRSQEKNLSKEIAAKKKRDATLRNQIAAMIRREVEEARKRAEAEAKARAKAEAEKNKENTATTTTVNPNTSTSKPAAKPKSYLDLNAKDVTLNAKFENNKGSIPWPVDNGAISIPFGPSKVEGLVIDNIGLTIATPGVHSAVKSVFDGEVTAVSNIGDGYVVMVRHGKYFTVYSNLHSASVSRGSMVQKGQVIGTTNEADDGSGGTMDFMLMVESKNVNPTPWLRR